MSDELKIEITTQADVRGAEEAARALGGLEQQVKSGGGAAERGARALDTLREAAKGAAWQVPVLGRVIQAVISPVSGLSAVLAGTAQVLVEYVKKLRETSEQSGLSSKELVALEVAQGRAKEAWEKLKKSLENPPETATNWLERQNAAVKELLENTLQVAEAQKALQVAQINLAEAKGEITPMEAEGRRLGVEVAYGEFVSAERVSALQQMIVNRKAAIEMARAEAERTTREAAAARELANQAQLVAVEKGIQAQRVAEQKPEIDLDGLMNTLTLGPAAWYLEGEQKENRLAHEQNRLMVERGAARAGERARRAAEAAAEAERRAVEARGRLGGLSGADEIGRLERQIEVLRTRGTLERRTRLTEAEAERERGAGREREARAAEVLREFGAMMQRTQDVRALNEALKGLMVELQRLGYTAEEVRRVTQEMRRNGGGVNGRLPP